MATRLIAGFELVLIVLPTTLVAIVGGAGGLLSASLSAEGLVFALSMMVAVLAIASMWRLLTPLMLGGYARVQSIARSWWRAMYAGGVFVAIGLLAMLVAQSLIDLSHAARSAL